MSKPATSTTVVVHLPEDKTVEFPNVHFKVTKDRRVDIRNVDATVRAVIAPGTWLWVEAIEVAAKG
jgi:hypothetical protein